MRAGSPQQNTGGLRVLYRPEYWSSLLNISCTLPQMPRSSLIASILLSNSASRLLRGAATVDAPSWLNLNARFCSSRPALSSILKTVFCDLIPALYRLLRASSRTFFSSSEISTDLNDASSSSSLTMFISVLVCFFEEVGFSSVEAILRNPSNMLYFTGEGLETFSSPYKSFTVDYWAIYPPMI